MSKTTKEEAKRKKITESYNKKINKCQYEMTARVDKIKKSEEYQRLVEQTTVGKLEKLKVLYDFSKLVEKYYNPERMKHILQNSKEELQRFNDFYGSLVEIVKMYEALKKINFEGKNSFEIAEKIVDIDFKGFGKSAIDFATVGLKADEKKLRQELKDFLDGKKEIKTGSEVVKEVVVDTGRYMGKQVVKVAVAAGKEGVKILLHNNRLGV